MVNSFNFGRKSINELNVSSIIRWCQLPWNFNSFEHSYLNQWLLHTMSNIRPIILNLSKWFPLNNLHNFPRYYSPKGKWRNQCLWRNKYQLLSSKSNCSIVLNTEFYPIIFVISFQMWYARVLFFDCKLPRISI